MIIITEQGALMDIKDAKPTCGCMNRDTPERTCTLPAGHTGLHHWRPYPNASSGSTWDDSLAVSALAAAQPAPTASEHPPVLELLIETLRTRAAAGALKYGTRLKPFNGRDAMVDLLQELADGCMYVMQAIAERDAVAQQCHNCNSTMVQCAGCEFSGTWDRSLSLRQERDADAKLVETLTQARDLARSELDLCTGRLQTAVTAVAESRHDATLLRDELVHARQAAAEWAAKAREYERAFGPLVPAHGPMLRADDVVAQPAAVWWPCPRSKAKQVGSSSYVVRRCKLADGHDEMCEPA